MIGRREFLAHLSSVLLCTLLNSMDGVTYGLLIFPLDAEEFDDRFRIAGIEMYLLCTAVSQLVLTALSSFRSGVAACMMVEHLPFLHLICRQIILMFHDKDVIWSNTIAMYFLGTIIVSVLFFALELLGMDRWVHQLPRPVLCGSLGGIGLFLGITGLEAILKKPLNWEHVGLLWLEGNFWLSTISISLALLALIIERKYHPPCVGPISTTIIFAAFYLYMACSGWTMGEWRDAGWLLNFKSSPASPRLFIYRIFEPALIQWRIIPQMLPTLLSAAVFAVLHVPINVPSFARTFSCGFRMKQELRAHGFSNLATSFVGILPNYFAYTNSVLFLKGGATGRLSGYLLAGTTLLLAIWGMRLVQYVPTLVMLFLIFYLSLDLMREAMFGTLSLCTTCEYLIILGVMFSMPVIGFLQGVGLGLVASLALLLYNLLKGRKRPAMATPRIRNTLAPSVEAFLRFLRPQIHIISIIGQQYFGNSLALFSRLRNLSPNIQFIILDWEGCTSYDMNIVEGVLGTLNTLPVTVLIAFGLQDGGVLKERLRELGVCLTIDLSDALCTCDRHIRRIFLQHEDENEDETSLLIESHVDRFILHDARHKLREIKAAEERITKRAHSGRLQTLRNNELMALSEPPASNVHLIYVVQAGRILYRSGGIIWRCYDSGAWILPEDDNGEYFACEEETKILLLETDSFDREDLQLITPFMHPE